MLHSFRQYTILTALFLVVVLGVPHLAAAADFEVTPLAINKNLAARDIVNEQLTLTNTTNHVIRLYASVNEVQTDGNGVLKSFVQASAADRTVTPTAWIAVTRARIELKPGEKRDIPLTITMDPKTQPGAYSVFVGFAEGSNAPEANNKVLAGNGKGTLINLTVDVKQDQFLKLERFVTSRVVTGDRSQSVSYSLKNASGVNIVPQGDILFYNMRGVEVGSVDLNTEKVSINPNETKDFTAAIPNDLGVGKYKAFLTVTYGEHQTRSLNDTAYFYILPLKALIIIFLVTLVLAVLIALYVHRRYDVDDDGTQEVAMYRRHDVSEDKEHDINLKQK